MTEITLDAPSRLAESVAPQARTLGDVLRRRASATPDAIAHYQKEDGEWQRTTWRELYDAARRVAQGLVELGVEPGERVAILGPTRAEWAEQDFGAQLIGAVSVGVYPLQSVEQVRYLLEHSESRVIFVADEAELQTVLEAARGSENLRATLRAIVPWETELATRFANEDERVIPLERFRGEPLAEEEIEQRLATVDPASMAILIYTSGTTGPPKGAMISHANIKALLENGHRVFPFRQDDLMLSFLPMAHATERVLSFYLRVGNGVAAGYASSMGAILEELREVRPTVFGSVPRIFEKAYARIQSEMAQKPVLVQRIFAWADGVGRRRVRLQLAGKRVPAALGLQYGLAKRLVFNKIHAAFGGRVRAFITGAAPTSYDILEFFWAAGLPIYEAYGMTEATVLTHINRPDAVRLGTVGRVVKPLECRVADDGEVLLRGPMVFLGYFKNEEATRETLVDGWLQSGDIGEIDEDGYLRVTDRKKHLIITAGGKNVAPANIERAIKDQSPLISQVHAHGDRRPYISAILAPSPLETLDWGAKNGLLSAAELEERRVELMANPSARSPALNEAMAKVTAEKRFQELFRAPVERGQQPHFSQEEGELTPTMKTKRKFIEEKYAPVFERIYGEKDFALEP